MRNSKILLVQAVSGLYKVVGKGHLTARNSQVSRQKSPAVGIKLLNISSKEEAVAGSQGPVCLQI